MCLGRHYCAYANLSCGKKTHAFFQDLIARRFVAIHPCGHGRARLYRVRYKPLWTAIGQPDNRNRKFTTLPRAVERLMLLDAVLERRDTRWLATGDEKVSYFRDTLRVRMHKIAWKRNPRIAIPPVFGVLVTEKRPLFTLRSEYAVTQG